MRTSSTRSRAPAACSVGLVDPAPVELRERVGERLARHPALGLVLAAPADPVVLLGDVDELEEERERPQDGTLTLEAERGDRVAERTPRSAGARVARERADPLLLVEEVLALLLDEHPPEQVAEEAHVGAERGVGRHRLSLEKRRRGLTGLRGRSVPLAQDGSTSLYPAPGSVSR